MTRLAPWLGLLVLVMIAGACATNPVTGRRELSLVSSTDEQKIGLDGYPAVLAEYGRYDEGALGALVDSVGHRVARVSHLPGLDWHFTLLDDDAVNAFAMPGGYIYVTRGILAHLNSEAQLAGVLGHEIGHVTHRHTAEQITKQQLYGLGLGLASAVSPTFSRYSGAAQSALGLLFLQYSRVNETEADELGVEYATRAGYDPREIPATYAMLKRVSEAGGQRMPSFLSTHPDPGDREARTTELARAAAAGKSGLVIRGRAYIQGLEGVVYGRDPRHGYFEAERYYHPAMGFQISFPAGWTYQDSRTAVAAAAPNNGGAMQLSLAAAGALDPSGYVDQLLRTARITEAHGGRERIGGYDAWIGRVTVAAQGAAPTILVAAFVRKTPDQMFQVLGRGAVAGDAAEGAVLVSARSFRSLSDPARANPTPDRVHVMPSPAVGVFQTVLERLGPSALTPTETSVINNLQLDEDVQVGQLLKVVRPGHTH
jgi:predicted Zn-dependent protease